MGLPILNRPDLMKKMMRSVDATLDRFYIVDNGGVVGDMEKAHARQLFRSVHVVDPGFNLGVAASWNLIIRANIHAPWWLLVNNDLVFEPGVLDRFLAQMAALDHTKPQLVCIEMGNEGWGNHFGAFAPNAACIDEVGWFDENFNPIYFEDTEYKERLKLLDIEPVLVPSSTQHVGNQSWKGRGQEPLAKANTTSWKWNGAYFDEKLQAMRNEDIPVSSWDKPSVARLRATDWPVPIRSSVTG